MKKFYFIALTLITGLFTQAQTTILVNNIVDPGGAGIGNRVVFVNFTTGEIGSTDGTVAGTVLIPSGTVVLASDNAARLGNKIIFIGFNALTGNELWSSDGTVAGTAIIKDIHLTGSSNPQGGNEGFTIIGNTLYFTADDGINGRELWKTDGTTAGTVMVKDMNASAINFATPIGTEGIGNTVFFTANVGTDGLELWKTDGTTAGTVMVKNITAGAASTTFSNYFVGNGTYVWFVANDGTNGFELWRTDGTNAGTIMLQNISGAGDAFSLFSGGESDWGGIIFNGMLYFNPNGTVSGNQLWKSDGTTAGTTHVVTINPTGTQMNLWEAIILGGKFYFGANGPTGFELYGSDGTAAGTTMIKDIHPTGSTNLRMLIARENLGSGYDRRPFRGKIMFLADDGTNGYELWSSDGTSAGTTLVKNINAGAASAFSTSGDITYFYTHYKLFLVADNTTNGAELWETDGTNAGTVMIQDIWSGSSSSSVDIFGVAESTNRLVFRANNGDGYDILALTTSVVPFPLTLTDFTAQLKNEQAELKWTTQHEINFSHFNLQRSITGSDFSTIAKVSGKGGTAVNNYAYTDQLSKAGTYYYRLEMTDKDGKVNYSNILSLKFRNGFGFTLVPTRNEAIVTLHDVNGIVTFRLIDVNGKVHLQQKQKITAGEMIKIPVGHLASGIYIITVEYDGMMRTERFIR